jgi:hypothetical protein
MAAFAAQIPAAKRLCQLDPLDLVDRFLQLGRVGLLVLVGQLSQMDQPSLLALAAPLHQPGPLDLLHPFHPQRRADLLGLVGQQGQMDQPDPRGPGL